MISFRHKSNTKQIKIKSKRDLNQRMSPWLQGIFGIKNPIVGFKTASNKYYDTQTFYGNKQKFYGQVVDIIQAKDQLQISFVSDNLNSSSNIRNAAQPLFVQDFQEQAQQTYKFVTDIKSTQRRLQDNNDLSILFNIHQIYKNQIVQSINMIKSQQNNKIIFYVRILQPKSNEQSSYNIYVGRKLVATLNLTRQYKQTIVMVIDRYAKKLKKNQSEKLQRQQQKQQQIFKVSYEQENQAPSFTTYQLQQRLNQDTCQDYLLRMFQQKVLKKYQFLKLTEKCQQNFIQFYKIFCQGTIDNDYQNFKNEVKSKVDNNLELLLNNVDQMDLSRPISRQEQRKQNLKRSVPNIQIVKVQNYFEILDQLKALLNPQTFSVVKSQLLDQNQTIFSGFSDYLSRKYSKEDLAQFLEKTVSKSQKRPVSRCLPRPVNKNRQYLYNSQDQILINPSLSTRQITTDKGFSNLMKQEISQIQVQPQKQQAQMIKLMGNTNAVGSGSKQNKNDNKQTPPMFGASKEQNNFSPIKYMSDIQSNYKQAWTRLQNKGDYFQPEQYGLLYYYLQTRDDSISNHIQQLQWNEQFSIDKLKKFLSNRIVQIMQQNFQQQQLNVLALHRNNEQINCIYQNFKYESDLSKFLSTLHAQLSKIMASSSSLSPPYSANQAHQKQLTKKASDSKLLNKKKSPRKYSDQAQQLISPKQSSFSHAKTNQLLGVQLQIFSSFWSDQLQQLLQHCNFSEQHREQYIRDAFKQGNPSVYSWINNFVKGKLGVINQRQLKSNLKFKQQQNRYVMKIVPIFSEILKSFVEDGKISEKMRKWCVVQLMELNLSVIGALQYYIKIKNSQQFVDSITYAYELQNSEMQYYRGYLKRIEQILKSMSTHDEISIQMFKLYPKHIKAICQLYFITGNTDELLDNLDALHQVQAKRRKLTMATLNFSGINTNPFQYVDGTQQLQRISQNMEVILKNQRQLIDNKLSSIDKCFSNNQMSIRFGDKICQGAKLLTRNEFRVKWIQYYNNNKPQEIKDDSPDIVESAMLFDYYCYLSTIKHVYGLEWKIVDYPDKSYKYCKKDYVIDNIQNIQSQKLKQFLHMKRNRKPSKISEKYTLTIDYLMKNQLDILFLQEAGTVDWHQQLVHEYGCVRGGDSIIIFRKDKFGGPRVNLHQEYKDKLNFNNDTAFYFSDRGYLLMSVHFKSNPEHYLKQAEQLYNRLEQVYQSHPMLKIIIGIDANHFIGGTANNFLNFVPKTKQQFTTNKIRTFLQVQFEKANIKSKMGKDYILTNFQIKNYTIQKINGKQATQNDILPSEEHPYDHFIVKAKVQEPSLNV